MRIAGIIVAIILIILGGVWTLQGSNMMPNTAMSGQSQWLYIGIVVLIVGIVGLIWALRRRRA